MRQRTPISIVVFVAGLVALTLAQTPTLPSFEVASVRLSTSDSGPATFRAPFRGTTVITNGPLVAIIPPAYGIPFTLERFKFDKGGRHDDVLNARFDITARPPADARPGQAMLMLRQLLAERFKLRVHIETRQMPVYTITVARAGRFGPNLRPSTDDCDPQPAQPVRTADLDPDARPICRLTWDNEEQGTRRMTSSGPMAQLVDAVQRNVDRPVIDATGLSGSFAWELRFAMRQSIQSPAPLIFTAMQEQLGLNLEPGTGPVEVLVIDSVEMPTPN